MTIAERIAQLGLSLPVPPAPLANYVPFKLINLSSARSLLDTFDSRPLVDKLLFISGMIPLQDGKPFVTGKVGQEVTLEDGVTCAQICTLNALGWANLALDGKLDDIAEVIQVRCIVASSPDFYDQPKVANGCSDMLAEIFGDDGKHTRVVYAAPVLPMNVPVEIDFLLSVR